MKIYDRQTRAYEETDQYGAGKLEFLYNKPAGRLLLKLAVSPFVSGIYGRINSTKGSARKIPGFINEQHIDMSDFEDREYTSFNEFFIRRILPGKRPVDMGENVLVSPADSKLLVYRISDDTRMTVKGREYTVSEILGEGPEASWFCDGYALVFRLCVGDYHRFCFPDSGRVLQRRRIKGRLHTVSSISKDYSIYRENSREVSILMTDHFGRMAFIEVGALLVGRIVDHDADVFRKGQEKGYFEPGGSTIILFVKDIEVDRDIAEQSALGIETKVRYGERVGVLRC